MLNKRIVIGGMIIGTILTSDLNALEFFSSDALETSNYSQSTESEKIDESGFFSDDIFILAKYEEHKKAEEEAKKKEEEKTKSSTESKASTFKPPSVDTTQVGKLRLSIHDDDYDTMVRKCNAMLASDAMAGQGENLVKAGIAYNIDPYILVGIAKVETTGGTYPHAQYNAWGRMAWNGPNWRWATWNSWKESIYDQAAYLANYLNNGRTTLYAIGQRYNPYHTEYWTNKVTKYQRLTANK